MRESEAPIGNPVQGEQDRELEAAREQRRAKAAPWLRRMATTSTTLWAHKKCEMEELTT